MGHRSILGLSSTLLLAVAGCDSGEERAAALPDVSSTPGVSVEVFDDVVLTEQAREPEQMSGYLGVRIEADTLRFSGLTAGSIVPGNVLAGTEQGGYLRRAVSVQMEGDELVVMTEPAELTDFIERGRFAIDVIPLVESWSNEPGRLSQGLTNPLALIPEGIIDAASCDVTGSLERQLGPFMDIEPQFNLLVDIEGAELRAARVTLGGELSAGFRAAGAAEGSISCRFDLAEALNRLGPWSWSGHAGLNRVRLPVTFTIRPTALLDLTLAATGGFELESSITQRLEVGAEYDPDMKAWASVWDPSREFVNQVEAPEVTLAGSASLRAGIAVEALIYDTFGPSLALDGELSASYRTEPLACVHEARLSSSLTGSVGVRVQLPLLSYTLAELKESHVLGAQEVVRTSSAGSCSDEGVDEAITLLLESDEPVVASVAVGLPNPELGELGGDVLFVFDRSSSFGDDLATFRAQALGIVEGLQASVSDLRIGLGSFSDAPCSGFGVASDFGYELNLALTSDSSAFQTVLESLDIRNGGDDPESQLEAMLQALTGTGVAVDGVCANASIPGSDPGWNPERLSFLILSTDAAFQQPRDGYPYVSSAEDVVQAATERGARVYLLDSGSSDPAGLDIAARTGGAAFELAADSSGVVEAITGALGNAIRNAEVRLVPDGDSAGFVASIVPEVLTEVDLTVERSASFDVTFVPTVMRSERPQIFNFDLVLDVNGARDEQRRIPVQIVVPPAS